MELSLLLAEKLAVVSLITQSMGSEKPTVIWAATEILVESFGSDKLAMVGGVVSELILLLAPPPEFPPPEHPAISMMMTTLDIEILRLFVIIVSSPR